MYNIFKPSLFRWDPQLWTGLNYFRFRYTCVLLSQIMLSNLSIIKIHIFSLLYLATFHILVSGCWWSLKSEFNTVKLMQVLRSVTSALKKIYGSADHDKWMLDQDMLKNSGSLNVMFLDFRFFSSPGPVTFVKDLLTTNKIL